MNAKSGIYKMLACFLDEIPNATKDISLRRWRHRSRVDCRTQGLPDAQRHRHRNRPEYRIEFEDGDTPTTGYLAAAWLEATDK